MPAVQKKVQAKKVATKFTIDVSAPATDGIFDVAAFEKYLHDRIKVDGRVNNLSDKVSVARAENVFTVTVAPNTQFAKRYIKYLTKKFLKKHQLRDWLRVIATTKAAYTIKYFNIAEDNAEDDE